MQLKISLPDIKIHYASNLLSQSIGTAVNINSVFDITYDQNLNYIHQLNPSEKGALFIFQHHMKAAFEQF